MQDFVHTFQAQGALGIQEVGDVCLLEAGLVGQLEAGQVPFFDATADEFAQVFLQGFEFHKTTISFKIWTCKSNYTKRIKVLTKIITLTQGGILGEGGAK